MTSTRGNNVPRPSQQSKRGKSVTISRCTAAFPLRTLRSSTRSQDTLSESLHPSDPSSSATKEQEGLDDDEERTQYVPERGDLRSPRRAVSSSSVDKEREDLDDDEELSQYVPSTRSPDPVQPVQVSPPPALTDLGGTMNKEVESYGSDAAAVVSKKKRCDPTAENSSAVRDIRHRDTDTSNVREQRMCGMNKPSDGSNCDTDTGIVSSQFTGEQRMSRIEERMDLTSREVSGLRASVDKMISLLEGGAHSHAVRRQENIPGRGKKRRYSEPLVGSSSEGDTSVKKEFFALMNNHLPGLRNVFSKHFVSACVATSIMAAVDADFSGSIPPPLDIEMLFGYVLFALKDGRKSAFLGGHGPKASRFRRQVMIRCLQGARVDLCGRFLPSGSDPAAAAERGDEREVLPNWLNRTVGGSDYIQKSHVVEAQKKEEGVANGKRTYDYRLSVVKSGDPGRDDICIFAMQELYGVLQDVLSDSRRLVIEGFFDNGGYLFVDWRKIIGFDLKDSEVHLSWKGELTNTAILELSEAPVSLTLSTSDVDRTKKNKETFLRWARTREEFILIARHDVLVRRTARTECIRRHRGTERKEWTYALSLMDMALHVLKGLCGFGRSTDVYEVLAYHRRSVFVVSFIAVALRVVLDNRPDRCIHGSEGGSSGQQKTLTEEERKALDSVFNFLCPTDNAVQRSIFKLVCSVSEHRFTAEHIGGASLDVDRECQGNGKGQKNVGAVTMNEDSIDGLDDCM